MKRVQSQRESESLVGESVSSMEEDWEGEEGGEIKRGVRERMERVSARV